ncbi:peptidoglycan DD-metalloendopeptidase family protein [Hyphomonas sp.]|jgi:murein DD-endopeptidase MepM/ murein hydrolase activator NlpD|uniref:peptidoglycan DD-metalloendopeptidase family protein n=1 Tax=Hyphomonas sp. TaxID=87 RepID=UPI0032D9314F
MSLLGLVCLALGWSAALWLLATALCALRPSPKMAQAIWRGAAALMFAPFLASAFMPGFSQVAGQTLPDMPVMEALRVQPGADFVEAAQPSFRMPSIETMILWGLVAGWSVRGLFWVMGQARLQRLKQTSRPVVRPVRHWADAIGLRRVPDVRVIPHGAPFLAGILRPVIFIPAALISKQHTPQIIVHELVHLKRGDLLTRPFDRMVADLFWFSPFAWAIRERLDYWREAIVDEETADLTGDRIAYARALTQVARHARPALILPVAAFTLKKEGTLKMRLTQLLSETPRRPKRLGLAVVAALALATPLALAQGSLIRGAAVLPADTIAYSHAVLDKAKLTSTFGMRKHPVSGEAKEHQGVDLAEEEGKPVYAPAAATVTRAEMARGYGNLVEISAGNTVLRFGQLKDINVSAGQSVSAGTIIGSLGQSGQATGPHLHLEVWRDGEAVDPMAEQGLVLADSLFITANSGAKVPQAPAAPRAPLTEPAPQPISAPDVGLGADQDVGQLSESCSGQTNWFNDRQVSDEWQARIDASRIANASAGLRPEKDWVPVSVVLPSPSYPVEAARQGKSGACMVMFDLGTDGVPANKIAECSDPVFHAEAIRLNKATFEPVMSDDGNLVDVKGVTYPLEFCIS